MVLGILSALTAGLFTGAAAYVILVEPPAATVCSWFGAPGRPTTTSSSHSRDARQAP